MPSIVVKDRKLGVVNRKLAVGECPGCCGATFCRAVDCCVPTKFAWFKSTLCGGSGDGCPTGVVNHAGRCWQFTGFGPLTAEEVSAQFPGERAYTVQLNCLSGCQDPLCPSCDDCCYESPPDPFCPDNDCGCMKPACQCGHRWTVAWQTIGSGRSAVCDFPGVRECEFYEHNAGGSLTWEYKEIAPDICDLVLVTYHGNLTASTIAVGTCGPFDEQDTMTVDASNVDYIYGSMYGCGFTWPAFTDMVGRMGDYITHPARKAVFSQCGDFVLTAYDFDSCAVNGDQTCLALPGFPGSHYSRTSGQKNCLGGSMSEDAYLQCDLDCAEVARCHTQAAFTVTVEQPCDDAGGGDLDQTGGTLAPPPDAGVIF